MVTAQEMGKKGGQAKSPAKAEAARKNASKPRGKWVTAIAYMGKTEDGRTHFDVFVMKGRKRVESESTHDAVCSDAKVRRWVDIETRCIYQQVG